MTYIRGRDIPTSWYVSKISSDSDVGNNKDRPFLTMGRNNNDVYKF